MATYPKRQSHFAHKLVRLMLHSCAAQEIGPDGFLLVAAIAHAEDAKRYCGAVTYWNQQLVPILGFGSWGQLDRARKKAVDAGWLHYEEGGKGKVGRYWTTVPGHLLDAPDVSTESDHHVCLSNSGEDSVKETGKKRERTGGQPGDNRGTSGEHSTLALIPSPEPTPNTSCSEPSSTTTREPKPAEPIAENFPPVECSGKVKSWRMTAAKLFEWRETFATVDVDAEIRKAIQWLRDNPGRRKTASGMPTFIGRWLTKATNDTGRGGVLPFGNGTHRETADERRARKMIELERDFR